MKKLVLFLYLFLISFIVNAQIRSITETGSTFNHQKVDDPEFDINQYVGIFNYNIKKSAKKTSVKLNTKEGEQFSKLLTNHNKKIKDIERINSFILKSTKEMVENFQKNVLKTGNLSNQQKVAKELKENTLPIYKLLKQENDLLNNEMNEFLSEKQLKKWKKYNKNLFPIIE